LKSNIGHTQAAAGVGGVIKMIQAMRHGVLPKTLHAEEPSPHVDWSEGEVRLLSEQVPWERNGVPRRAGVSSFGISGTNAHVILEEAPVVEEIPPVADGEGDALGAPRPGALPFLVSAASDEALRAQAARLGGYVHERPELELAGVAGALALDRARLSHRAVVVVEGREALVACLGALERGVAAEGLFQGVSAGGRTAFLFSGQGSQWAGMGVGLYEAFPMFASALDEVCGVLNGHLERSLQELLFAAEDSEEAVLLGRTQFTQPALFALEVALFRLVSSFGVKPDFLLGHSIGELSAAHVAGVLSLDDACVLVAARGRLMGALPDGGGMAAAMASEDEVLESLSGFEGRLTVAAVNGPEAVVVSGELDALTEWEAVFAGRKVTRLRVSHAFHSHLMDPMLDEFAAIVEGLSFGEPSIPIVSNVSGELAGGELATAEYWVGHVREAVRFCDGVRSLETAGVTSFLELGPNGVLSSMAYECLDGELQDTALLVSTLRAHHPQAKALLGFLAQADTRGVEVDWSGLFTNAAATHVELPTYAFQRRHYWLEAAADATDASSLGLAAGEHPLLGAALHLAGEREGWLFTGRLSLKTHPWLRDHAVMDQVLVPATGFVELALAAGQRVGSEVIEELAFERPLLLDEDGAVQLQLTIAEPDETGARSIAVYSRRERAAEDASEEVGEWTRHAFGMLGKGAEAPFADGQGQGLADELRHFAAEPWPPQGARELDTEFLYDRLAEVGYNYGPVFQGLRSAWLLDGELYAEIGLAGEQQSQAPGFCLHPALLDAALHTALLGALDDGQTRALEVPFSVAGVQLCARGASALRVRLGGDGAAQSPSLLMLDEQGAPVLSIARLETRAIDQEQLKVARTAGHDTLYELQWVELQSAPPNGSKLHAALLGGPEDIEISGVELERHGDLAALEQALRKDAPAPELVLIYAHTLVGQTELEGKDAGAVTDVDGDLARNVHRAAARTLELLQQWIASEPLAEAKLLLVTENAVTVSAGEAPNLAQAALVGLVRSAQSEHPGRFGLLDLDGSDASIGSLYGALVAEEPELALRAGALHAPRLARVAVQREAPTPAALDPRGTVLITGGTGGLGALVARHLAAERGVERLLLVSRSGPAAEGAQELAAGLQQLGCDVRIAACDVSDRVQLEQLLASVPPEHPLSMAIHTAGVLDDGVIESLDGERLARVMTPKVDAAINLHELTAGTGLAELILFSSVAATLGTPGQGNYAAGNAFLDALAAHRRAHDLPGVSLAWGAWDRAGGMTETLSEVDRARLARIGIASLSDAQGLELFDLARGLDRPLLVPTRLDTAALRLQAKAGTLPAILRGLIRMPTRRASEAQGSLATRLSDSPESEWEAIVAEQVTEHTAGVLGHVSAAAVDPQRAFKELGFDSLAAVELRNRLGQTTGLKLPSTLVFDYPTPAAVAGYLLGRLAHGVVGSERDPREAEIRRTIASVPIARLQSAGVLDVLLALADSENSASSAGPPAGAAIGEETNPIESMDVASLLDKALEIGRPVKG
jgi:acyl transferase domain-containing protein/acyl carrier protein